MTEALLSSIQLKPTLSSVVPGLRSIDWLRNTLRRHQHEPHRNVTLTDTGAVALHVGFRNQSALLLVGDPNVKARENQFRTQHKFDTCNCVLYSPADLFAARSREQSLPQRSHGQKDFLPDGSEAQNAKLQVCHKEQWKLLGEERVERLGSLVRGVWKPNEELVELTSPAGKFWQTMGFTEHKKQCLLPEEAVYLLECGTIQLYFRDLLLSVQDAYERLLTHQSVTMLHYQVYSHLKRLGYVVTRFDPSFVQSTYERQINMKTGQKPHRKRKRSSSPKSLENMITLSNQGPPADRQNVEASSKTSVWNKGESCSTDGQIPTNSVLSGDQLVYTSSFANNITENMKAETADQLQRTKIGSPTRKCRWDFSKIIFPNCASDHSCKILPPPEPAMLPENVAGRRVDISQWLHKLNLNPEKMSRREREQWEWEHRFKSSINADPKVQKCGNWREYKKLLQDTGHSKHAERPPHLWASNVTPLVVPEHGKTTASVLEQITVMHPSYLLECNERLKDNPVNTLQVDFNVYKADGTSEFKKSRPGRPYARMCVRSFDEPIPSLRAIKSLALKSGDVPVVFALVDCGEVAFYSFKDFKLPVDVYP
ncbi:tRNA-splicing endonuclease subunit Sen54 [Pelodytes ibericus]